LPITRAEGNRAIYSVIRIGTSGWVYGDWRGRFYPQGLGQARWLSYYAERFDTVELNATTYRLPTPEQVRRWCQTVPANFAYTVKLSRLITHRKTMPARVDEFIENYMHRAACFESGKVAQILVQFPPYLERDDEHLRAFLDKMPSHHRYVVEFRHRSWLVPQVEHILRERNMAFCVHDYPGFRTPDIVTSNELAYVRLHGYTGLYVGNYPRRSLHYWARRIRGLADRARDVYVYFNNDTLAAAPHDAKILRSLL
jgi:uncharacterized protein YecE (DUF72 family)